jgi:hypothetical protein
MTLVPNLIGSAVDVRSFAPQGTPLSDPTMTVDWQPYIQAAIDYLMEHDINAGAGSSDFVGTLYLPPGRYYIDSPIQIRRISSSKYTYCSIHLVGDAPPYGDGFNGTIIIPSFVDKPAIIIQCGRSVRLKDLAIYGKNNWASTYGATDMATHYDDTNYLVNSSRDGRYSPYAGICIDPFCGTEPTIGGVAAGYPGLSSAYLPSGDGTGGTSGSGSIQIESCWIGNFTVGIMISPNLVTQNAENITIIDSIISSTKHAVAVGQDQSRNVTLRNIAISGAKYAINCTEYGRRGGNCPSIFGANIGGVRYVFSTWSAGGTPSINGLYCESFLSIGQLFGSTQQDGHVFNSCAFNFAPTPAGKPSVDFRLCNTGLATFNGCVFSLQTARNLGEGQFLSEPMLMTNNGFASFNECFFTGASPDEEPRFWINGNPERVKYTNCLANDFPFTSGGAILSDVFRMQNMFTDYNRPVVPGCTISEFSGSNTDRLLWVAGGIADRPFPSATSVTVNADGTATFSAPASTILKVHDLVHTTTGYDFMHAPANGSQNDVILGKVKSIVGGVVTLEFVPEFVPATAPASTTHALSIRYFARVHPPTTGTVTASSNEITEVTNVAYWFTNTRILEGIGRIQPGTYITGVDIGLNKITLSTTLASSAAGVRLFDADLRQITTTKL